MMGGAMHGFGTSLAGGLNSLLGATPLIEARLLSGGVPSQDCLDGDSIRILTWNLHKQTHPSWRLDFDRLLDECRPHILNLQEARTDGMLAVLSARPETWSWMASPNLALPASGTEAGVFTAVLAPLRNGIALLSEAAEPLILSRKAMLRCETLLKGAESPLLCLNIHSLNFKLGLAGFRDQLARLLEGVGDHQGPVMLSGDFNTWSRKRMDLLLRMTESAQLRRVDFPASGRPRGLLPALVLDHVFYSHKSLRPRAASARILGHVRSSDHAPLLVDLHWGAA
jgi:endonuclease/exonuclease/phosphatase (EEP) superfamily protein YafD